MKYIFFLNGERGFSVLRNLIKIKKYNLVKVIICRKNLKQPLKKIININRIKYIKDINKKKSLIYLNNFNTDIFIIAGYPQIFSKSVLKIPKKITINLHGGPIPQYRGGSPLNWQIINNEKKIGISVLTVNHKIDSGNLIENKFFPLNKQDDINIVHRKANKFFFIILKKALIKLNSNKTNIFLKKKGNSKYWHQRRDSDGLLKYKSKTAVECYNFIRAITKPYPGAWVRTIIKNKTLLVRLYKSEIFKPCNAKDKIFFQKNKMYIPCKDRFIKVLDYKILYAR